ncbi:hypothetical protein AZ34_00440 [Hylemonella gracilis str. Niagara R]|uniref:ORC1/DEAH AAA+ ATPase domain-containing protein n=1 Tax=Hylemonella gracilis str. Niagara R TaxID=1458275 RepID=A0A016XNE1_9BURK|nr:AAA family ATPase [Hylemonella gracilis]EYC52738.1 hypothetical protein AZ34_00440 [Hylemonella gracilis str. Niagara R]
MKMQSLVPASVLASSNAEREQYFSSTVVEHPYMKRALTRLNEATSAFDSQRMILLLGGAGVGKTALLEALVSKRFDARKEEMLSDRRRVPALFVELEPPVTGKFSFVPFYREALGLMNAAAIDKTLPISQRRPGRDQILFHTVDAKELNTSGERLKIRFRNNLIDRQVEIVALDEAIFAFEIGSSSSHEDRLKHVITQANHLRSFINKSPTTFILAGAHDFFELTVSTSQLARRSSIVHFEPYGMDNEGISGFTGALIELLRHLPVENAFELHEHATELLLQSLGCIGNLKDILKRALSLSLQRSVPLSFAVLRECFLSPPAHEAIRQEMVSGTKRLSTFLSNADLARHMLEEPRKVSVPVSTTKKLKPGEMKPSFRREATDKWDS